MSHQAHDALPATSELAAFVVGTEFDQPPAALQTCRAGLCSVIRSGALTAEFAALANATAGHGTPLRSDIYVEQLETCSGQRRGLE
jgi:hypothetical protein